RAVLGADPVTEAVGVDLEVVAPTLVEDAQMPLGSHAYLLETIAARGQGDSSAATPGAIAAGRTMIPMWSTPGSTAMSMSGRRARSKGTKRSRVRRRPAPSRRPPRERSKRT